MSADTLAGFLLARIAEDEEQARQSRADNAMNPNLRIPAAWINGVVDRVLAECEAKRRIVDELSRAEAHVSEVGGRHELLRGLRSAARSLAAVYADHPDYRQEWKP